MGVAWGIVHYPANEDRDEIIADWRDLALDTDEVVGGFNIMHGTDRIYFDREETADGQFQPRVSVTPDPEARAKVDALSTGDGTYALFEMMFDGLELLVPWDMDGFVKRPGCIADKLLSECVWDVRRAMRASLDEEEYEPGTDLHILTSELLAATELATELRMLVQISY